jgi:serine/threonine-protein kinase
VQKGRRALGSDNQDDPGPTVRARASTSPWPPRSEVAPAWAGPQAGALLDGTYRILRPLGEGGMGLVLLARDERLDREVAIKVIRPDCREYEDRLIDEARAMARVHHQNVVEIYAFGSYADAPYFVMEYLPSETLDTWCARHGGPPIPIEDVLRILDPVCQGVAAIHASDTTHRDLKPSNILIGPSFRVMVADLGLARPIAPWSETAGRDTVSGTPEYIAPEVAMQKDVAPHLRARADVYSLAVIAFELLTGRLPFVASTPVELLRAHALHPPPAPRSIKPDLPEAIDEVLLLALAKDPVNRTASATAFRKALEKALERPAASEPPTRRSSVPADPQPARTRTVVPPQAASGAPRARTSLPPNPRAPTSPAPPPNARARTSAPPPPLDSGPRPPMRSSPSIVPRALRLLVADDDDHVRGIVARVLAKTFPEAVVESVSDGTKVMASLEWHIPSLALLDLDMPGMNALEIVASLRPQERTKDVPIVVMTGKGTPSDLRLLQQLGAQAFLVKPFHPMQLVAVVRDLLGDGPGQGAAGER